MGLVDLCSHGTPEDSSRGAGLHAELDDGADIFFSAGVIELDLEDAVSGDLHVPGDGVFDALPVCEKGTIRKTVRTPE